MSKRKITITDFANSFGYVCPSSEQLKVYQTLKKKAFLWFKKEKVSCEKAYCTLQCIEK